MSRQFCERKPEDKEWQAPATFRRILPALHVPIPFPAHRHSQTNLQYFRLVTPRKILDRPARHGEKTEKTTYNCSSHMGSTTSAGDQTLTMPITNHGTLTLELDSIHWNIKKDINKFAISGSVVPEPSAALLGGLGLLALFPRRR